MKSFGLHVLTGRWFMVFATLLIMSIAGATYTVCLNSSHIKSSLGYDQTTLNLLSFFKDLGGNVGLLSGLIHGVTPPWVELLIGVAMNFSGYFMIWLAFTGKLAKPSVWQMCLYIWVGANSHSFFNNGALVTCVKNFPESEEIVLGLLKSFVELSGAIVTQLYHAIYGDNSKSLILLIAWLPAALSFIFLRTIRIMKTDRQTNEVMVFYNLLYISVGIAGLLMLRIVVQNRASFSRIEYVASFVVVLVLLFAPVLVVVQEQLKTWKAKKQVLEGSSSQAQVVTDQNPPPPTMELERPTPPAGDLKSPRTRDSCWSNAFRPPDRGEDYTILQAVFSVNMIILIVVTTCGVGGTLTAIDNLSQIGRSLGYPASTATTFISLVSIWKFLGRVVSSFASETFLSKYKFPRPLMFSLVLLLSCFGHLLIAFGVPNSLYVATVIIGFSFRAQWQLLFAIISEIFKLKYHSTLYNFGTLASMVGMCILNVRVAGRLYDQQALKQMEAKGLKRLAGKDLTCTGVECYKKGFIVITIVTMFGFVVSLVLVLRTRKFYRGDIYRKFKEQAEAAAGGWGGGKGVVQLREEASGSTVAGFASANS
ncbi:uncharacterized protein LOC127792282 [Diospyros lotus]|uniref:uncharacterized protein LOC127792282 n=1 Tax=Diospyros lotus TaxID=55363 RepID=UPI00224D20DD|nr:uncharacterized protein LOC127792282 [Diospyros lotus]